MIRWDSLENIYLLKALLFRRQVSGAQRIKELSQEGRTDMRFHKAPHSPGRYPLGILKQHIETSMFFSAFINLEVFFMCMMDDAVA